MLVAERMREFVAVLKERCAQRGQIPLRLIELFSASLVCSRSQPHSLDRFERQRRKLRNLDPFAQTLAGIEVLERLRDLKSGRRSVPSPLVRSGVVVDKPSLSIRSDSFQILTAPLVATSFTSRGLLGSLRCSVPGSRITRGRSWTAVGSELERQALLQGGELIERYVIADVIAVSAAPTADCHARYCVVRLDDCRGVGHLLIAVGIVKERARTHDIFGGSAEEIGLVDGHEHADTMGGCVQLLHQRPHAPSVPWNTRAYFSGLFLSSLKN